jgi:soluble lytic murein transglycosylase-like protein
MFEDRHIHLLWWSIFLSIIIYFTYTAADVYGRSRPDTVPPMAFKLRSDLIRTSRYAFGLQAPSSTFGAQIHAESTYNPNARSRVGAAGLSQVMPGTARWLAIQHPDLQPPTPLSPGWAMLALARYNKYHWDRIGSKFTPCDRLKMTLAAYNGGYGILRRKTWPRETVAYVKRIIYTLEPLYEAAQFGPGSTCNRKDRRSP